jgi:inorganic pyrophosphatase
MYFDKAIDSYTQAEQAEMFLKMFEAIAGYGLGGSTVALFGRVGGGIYTKAADVGADLVGKVIEDMDEDSIQNPGVIADNVGDNVGDIAGMGSDLFGSFAESTCACLVISATSPQLVASQAFFFPMMISALGIVVGLITSFVSTHMISVDNLQEVEKSLKAQLYVSTILMTPAIWIAAMTCLPSEFSFNVVEGGHVNPTRAFFCSALGLWSGLIIGLTTEFYTSGSHAPV